jgi:preprotein translocase subunit SecA
MIGAPARKLSGSGSDRRIESRRPRVDAINALESALATLSDDELRARTSEFKQLLGTPPKSPLSKSPLSRTNSQ